MIPSSDRCWISWQRRCLWRLRIAWGRSFLCGRPSPRPHSVGPPLHWHHLGSWWNSVSPSLSAPTWKCNCQSPLSEADRSKFYYSLVTQNHLVIWTYENVSTWPNSPWGCWECWGRDWGAARAHGRPHGANTSGSSDCHQYPALQRSALQTPRLLSSLKSPSLPSTLEINHYMKRLRCSAIASAAPLHITCTT